MIDIDQVSIHIADTHSNTHHRNNAKMDDSIDSFMERIGLDPSTKKQELSLYGESTVALVKAIWYSEPNILPSDVASGCGDKSLIGSITFQACISFDPESPKKSVAYLCLGFAACIMGIFSKDPYYSMRASVEKLNDVFQKCKPEVHNSNIIKYINHNSAFYDLVYGFYIKTLIDPDDTWFKADQLASVIKLLGDGCGMKGGANSENTGVDIFERAIFMETRAIQTLGQAEQEQFHRECWKAALEDWLSSYACRMHTSLGKYRVQRIEAGLIEKGLKERRLH